MMKDKDIQSEEFEARVERLSLGEHAEGSPEMAHRPVPLPKPWQYTSAEPLTTERVAEIMDIQSIRDVPALTEERVRAIFREEIAKWEQDLAKRMRMQGKPAWWV